MSLNGFLTYLQQLITMVDAADPRSVGYARAALKNTVELARLSGKAGGPAMRVMVRALDQFDDIIRVRNQFAAEPGEFQENERKRRRLCAMLQPGC